MKGLTLTQREQTRLQVLNRLVAQQLTPVEATTILGVSERHTWRMLAAYRKEGAAALPHGNRGRRPLNAVAEETRERVVALARTRYAGLNHTHLQVGASSWRAGGRSGAAAPVAYTASPHLPTSPYISLYLPIP